MCNKKTEHWLWLVSLSNGSQQYVAAETAKKALEIAEEEMNGVTSIGVTRHAKVLM